MMHEVTVVIIATYVVGTKYFVESLTTQGWF